MNWHSEKDVCTFLQIVKEQGAHKGKKGHQDERSGKDNKWERVRKALIAINKSNECLKPKILSKHFTNLRKEVIAKKFPARSTQMTKVEAAVYDMLQDANQNEAAAVTALQEREATVRNTIPVHAGKGNMRRQFQNQDDVLCKFLRVLEICKVHQHEEAIPMHMKWTTVCKMLERTFPNMKTSNERKLMDYAFPIYFRSIAFKFGVKGELQPAEQKGMLQSEKIACRMLAEDTTERTYDSQGLTTISTDSDGKLTTGANGCNGKKRKRDQLSDGESDGNEA